MPDGPTGMLVYLLWLVLCCIPVVMGLHALGNWIDRRNAKKQIEEEFRGKL